MTYFGWRPYVPVAEKRRQAERKLAKLKRQGKSVAPVTVEGSTIAKSFWGKSWCSNLERYSDYENRLPRGRTYVRNGSVVDLQITKGEVAAMVAGSELYRVKIAIAPVTVVRWRAICRDCAGTVDSLVELLQGRLAKGVMDRVCREGDGLFPSPGEIKLSCSCPDWADMCKHVAAVLYGIGARIDQRPDLLFRLHEVDEKELIAGAGKALPLARKAPAATKVLRGEDLSDLFGLDLAQGTGPDTGSFATTPAEPERVKTQAGKLAPAVPGGKGKVRAQGSASRRRKQSTASRESSGSKKK